MTNSVLASDALAGTVALVTGGGTGIGRACALELAACGADVVICGRRSAPLAEVRELIERAGGRCLAVPADLCIDAAVDAVVAAAMDAFGAVDVVVNAAGGQFASPAEHITANGWRAVHRVSVDAAWSITRAVATASMIPRRQGVVFFVGFSPRRGMPGMVHAAAARAALENLASGLSLEWSRFGIRTICLAVGSIDTPALREGYSAEDVHAWERAAPLGRLGRPEEIAGLLCALASQLGSYVTGTTIAIDGGADAWGCAVPPPLPEPIAR